MTPMRFAFDPNFDEFGDYTNRAIQTLNILDDSSQPLTLFQPSGLINMLSGPTNMLLTMTTLTDYENLRPYFGWVNVDTVQKTIEQST